MSDLITITNELQQLKQYVYSMGSGSRFDYGREALDTVESIKAMHQKERAKLADEFEKKISALQAQIAKLDADDKKIVSDTHKSLKTLAEAVGTAVSDRCSSDEREMKQHISATLGSVHADVIAAKAAATQSVQTATDYLISSAAFIARGA
jgi:hypothetical protein